MEKKQEGQVVGVPDAAHVNAKLRGILNSYQDALDKINTSSYTCTQLVEYLSSVKQGAISYSVASAVASSFSLSISEFSRSIKSIFPVTIVFVPSEEEIVNS